MGGLRVLGGIFGGRGVLGVGRVSRHTLFSTLKKRCVRLGLVEVKKKNLVVVMVTII